MIRGSQHRSDSAFIFQFIRLGDLVKVRALYGINDEGILLSFASDIDRFDGGELVSSISLKIPSDEKIK